MKVGMVCNGVMAIVLVFEEGELRLICGCAVQSNLEEKQKNLTKLVWWGNSKCSCPPELVLHHCS